MKRNSYPSSIEQKAPAGHESIKDIVALAMQEYLNRSNNVNVTPLPAVYQAEHPPLKKPLTIKETAAFFQVSVQTVHNWRKSGYIQARKVGNRTYFLLDELLAVLNKKKAA